MGARPRGCALGRSHTAVSRVNPPIGLDTLGRLGLLYSSLFASASLLRGPRIQSCKFMRQDAEDGPSVPVVRPAGSEPVGPNAPIDCEIPEHAALSFVFASRQVRHGAQAIMLQCTKRNTGLAVRAKPASAGKAALGGHRCWPTNSTGDVRSGDFPDLARSGQEHTGSSRGHRRTPVLPKRKSAFRNLKLRLQRLVGRLRRHDRVDLEVDQVGPGRGPGVEQRRVLGRRVQPSCRRIQRPISGQVSASVCEPMNRPMCPPGASFFAIRSGGVPTSVSAAKTCSCVVISSSSPANR